MTGWKTFEPSFRDAVALARLQLAEKKYQWLNALRKSKQTKRRLDEMETIVDHLWQERRVIYRLAKRKLRRKRSWRYAIFIKVIYDYAPNTRSKYPRAMRFRVFQDFTVKFDLSRISPGTVKDLVVAPEDVIKDG